MALVRVGPTLLTDIRYNIDQMRTKERNTLKHPGDLLLDPTHPKVLKLMGFTDQELELLPRLSDDWFYTVDYFTMIVRYSDGVTNLHCNVTTRPMQGWRHFKKISRRPMKQEIHVADWPEVQPHVDYWLAAKEVDTRWTTTTNDVLKYVEAFPSLNKAVENWPGLKLYLPRHVMDRLDKETPKREKREVEIPKVDTEQLTAVAVSSRIS